MLKRKKLLLIGFVALLVMAVLFSFASFKNSLSKNLQDDIYQSLSEASTAHKFFFHCRLERELNILKTLASCTPANSDADDQFMFAMMDNLVETTGFQCFALVETDGTRITNDGMQDNVAELEVFQQAMKGDFAISQPMESLLDGVNKQIILMAYPVISNEKTVRCIFGAYEIDQLSSVLLSSSLQGTGYTTIINVNGDIIIRDDNLNCVCDSKNIFDFYNEVDFSNGSSISKMKSDLEHETEGSFSYDYLGETNLAYYEPAGVNDWYVLSVAPESVVNKHSADIFKIVNSLTLKIVIVFTVLVLFIFVKIKMESRKYQSKSERDSMTGISNKSTTEKLIDQALHRESEQTHALFLFDIDNFKGINDQFGHMAGDAVILKIAEILRDTFRTGDVVGRIGGDEFAVLLKSIPDDSLVKQKASEIIAAVENAQFEEIMDITISIGISLSKTHGDNFSQLYQTADKALYQAKNCGKNQFSIYSSDCNK